MFFLPFRSSVAVSDQRLQNEDHSVSWHLGIPFSCHGDNQSSTRKKNKFDVQSDETGWHAEAWAGPGFAGRKPWYVKQLLEKT